MKRIIIGIILISLCLGLTGCKSSDYDLAMELLDQGNYLEAEEIFDSLGDYEDSVQRVKECKYNRALVLLHLKADPLLEVEQKISLDIASSYASEEEKDNARALLESVGDYEDSIKLLEELDILQDYEEAVALFENGDLTEAREMFSAIHESFSDTKKYLAAIEYLKAVSGTWLTDSLEYNDRNTVAISVELKIGPPYSIDASNFGDCDWGVFANIQMNVKHIFNNGSTNFTVYGDECGSHIDNGDESDTTLGSAMKLTNNNGNHTIFDSKYGAFSEIWVELIYATNYEPYLKVTEIPYSVDWSTQYNDGGSLHLYVDMETLNLSEDEKYNMANSYITHDAPKAYDLLVDIYGYKDSADLLSRFVPVGMRMTDEEAYYAMQYSYEYDDAGRLSRIVVENAQYEVGKITFNLGENLYPISARVEEDEYCNAYDISYEIVTDSSNTVTEIIATYTKNYKKGSIQECSNVYTVEEGKFITTVTSSYEYSVNKSMAHDKGRSQVQYTYDADAIDINDRYPTGINSGMEYDMQYLENGFDYTEIPFYALYLNYFASYYNLFPVEIIE